MKGSQHVNELKDDQICSHQPQASVTLQEAGFKSRTQRLAVQYAITIMTAIDLYELDTTQSIHNYHLGESHKHIWLSLTATPSATLSKHVVLF